MFTHLATRTCYSLRDGVIRPAELARAAAEAGMEAVGIADRGGLYGMVRVAKACAEVGVRPIFGVDLALLPEGIDRPGERVRPGWEVTRATRSGIGRQMGPGSGPAWLEGDTARVVLIARDDAGFATLCRTVTDHHLESTRTDPHLSWAQAVHRLGAGDGVVVLLGDDSPVGRLLHAGRRDAAEAELRRWVDLVGADRVVLGVTHHLAPGDDARARRWFALADRTGIRAVAHQAARHLLAADALVADVMDAVRQQIPLDPRPHRDGTTGHAPPTRPLFNRRNAEGWFKDPAAMARLFAERPDAIANAQWVAAQCHGDLWTASSRWSTAWASPPTSSRSPRSWTGSAARGSSPPAAGRQPGR